MTPSLRPLTPADLPAVHQLHRRIEIHDDLPLITPIEEFNDWIADPHLDFSTDTCGLEVDGQLIGYGRLWHRPSGEKEERAYLLGGVDPRHRRQGMGSMIFTRQLSQAHKKLEALGPALPHFIRTQAYDFETGAIALYRSHGLVPVRYTDEMLRPLTELPPIPTIERIEVVPWNDGYSEPVRLVSNAAFADHWGSTPRDEQAWHHEINATGWRHDLSFVALDGDNVVGFSRNQNFPDDFEVTGRRDGWIGSLGVLRSHRGRGIARSLIIHSFHAFVAAGFDHAVLGVDTENPTGAYRLYEGLGFQRMTRLIAHQLPA
jgi:ribosomal protein S18 acetylase RimI-like enzyme